MELSRLSNLRERERSGRMIDASVEDKVRERKRVQRATDTLVEAVKKNRDIDELIQQGANARIACLNLELFLFDIEETDSAGCTALVRAFTRFEVCLKLSCSVQR